MKLLALTAALSLSLTALADPSPPATQAPAAPTSPPPTPSSESRVGSFQLMLQAPPFAVDGDLTTRGFGYEGSGGASAGYFGVTGGVGYVLTPIFELGGGVTMDYLGGGADVFHFLAEPFVKANFGSTFNTGTINPFVLGGVGLGFTTGSAQLNGAGTTASTGLVVVDLSPGVEWLFGGRWGVDAFVPIQIQIRTAGGNPQILFGAAYGLVGYL